VAPGELGRRNAAPEGGALSETLLHERTLSIESEPEGEGSLHVHAELRDFRHVDVPTYLDVSHPAGVVHHMFLDLAIDRDLVITAAEARMQTAPFSPSSKTWGEGCRDILPSYAGLVGKRLDARYAAEVAETVGGRLGCFHILSLAQCVPLAVRAAARRLCAGALGMPAGSRDEVCDSCVSWHAGSPQWSAVRETVGSGFRRHRRQIRMRARTDDGLRLGMTADLEDQAADSPPVAVELAVRLDVPQFTIRESFARFVAAPFESCGAVLPTARTLEGLTVTRGFTNAALERIGGASGCAALSALVIAFTPVIPQASGALAGYLALSPDQKLRRRVGNPQMDSCHMWRSDGPLVTLERSPKRPQSV